MLPLSLGFGLRVYIQGFYRIERTCRFFGIIGFRAVGGLKMCGIKQTFRCSGIIGSLFRGRGLITRIADFWGLWGLVFGGHLLSRAPSSTKGCPREWLRCSADTQSSSGHSAGGDRVDLETVAGGVMFLSGVSTSYPAHIMIIAGSTTQILCKNGSNTAWHALK